MALKFKRSNQEDSILGKEKIKFRVDDRVVYQKETHSENPPVFLKLGIALVVSIMYGLLTLATPIISTIISIPFSMVGIDKDFSIFTTQTALFFIGLFAYGATVAYGATAHEE